MPRHITAPVVIVVLAGLAPAIGCAGTDDWTMTVYGGRVSSETGWEKIITKPFDTGFFDSYLLTGALSNQYAQILNRKLALEWEGQVAYHFGDQTYWELNAVPIVARWRSFPWSRHLTTTAAFGLGLSYATEMPQVEVALKGESEQLLVYWLMELTAGPVDSPWSVLLRIHHRSVAFGLMGDTGGINAVAFGLRYKF